MIHIQKRTFAEFKSHLDAYSPENAAKICGVVAEDITEAAFRFGSAKATMSLWAMGINQQSQGTAANRLVNAMHLLTGQIGKPGATPFSLTGQPNAGGGVRDTGALAHALPNGRSVTNPAHRAEMEKLWNIPDGRISPKPGYHAISLFEAMAEEKVKCCLIMGTNPGHSLPNLLKYREGMEKTFLVVADSFHSTETTRFADVLLPAAMWTEKGGIYSQSERRYHHVPKLVDPPGEARPDLDILIDFSDRLGYQSIISARTYEAVWDEWRLLSAHSAYNFSGMTYKRLKKERGLLWPCPSEDHPGTKYRYQPGKDPIAKGNKRFDFYGRPDRRAIIWLDNQQKHAELITVDYPFVLTTGRILEHWHTMTITGKLDTLEEVETDFIQIHPGDAHRYGIHEGAHIQVKSRRGEAVFRASLTEDVRPGVVFCPFHSAKNLINKTTNNVYDPFSKQPEYKLCAVTIKPIIKKELALHENA